VRLGEDCGRPSTSMLGMLSYWYDWQGNEEDARRAAQRGLDVAPGPEHPATASCWFEFTGASAAVAAESPEAVAAFRHHVGATADTPDLDWFTLVCLTDASLNCDPAAAPALRQRLRDIAARVQSPRLTMFVHQYDGHALLLETSPPEFAGALHAYEQFAAIARATNDVHNLGIARRCLAIAATGLRDPDALTRCHDALEILFEIRHWQKIWQVLESTSLALATAGRTEHAAVILGHLDAHSSGFGIEHVLHFRALARELVDANHHHNPAKLAGGRPPPLCSTRM